MSRLPPQSAHLEPLFAALRDQLSLERTNPIDATAWFLGPKAENAEFLKEFVEMAAQGQIDSRIEYMPEDAPIFTEETEGHLESIDIIRRELSDLISALKGSIPLASYRNQSHMYWDVTLPGIVGYFAAMMYNQNNVAAEGSPVTTLLEIEVGRDLCKMLGFEVASDNRKTDEIVSWGHITCDGSVANGESMWAARNLKYLPVALSAAISTEPALGDARAVTVQTCQGRFARLIDLSVWELLNLPVDEAVGLVEKIEKQSGIDGALIRQAVDRHSVQNVGLTRFRKQFLETDAHAEPLVLTPATAHYSWPKTAALLGLGTEAVHAIEVDLDGRMSMVELRKSLSRCVDEQRPVVQVVAVLGSTAEGAIDPLAEIVQMRREFNDLGLNFAIHVDGAWGGYFTAMLRCPEGFGSSDSAEIIDRFPSLYLNDYFETHFEAIPRVDSITLDPHKSGFIQYPAGSLCYRNGDMRNLISFTSPVISHGSIDVTVGPYGIEGSKPGAAPAGVYLSHKVIPLNTLGYGRLLGRCLFNSKRFYAALVAMDLKSPGKNGVGISITPFQRLPVEKAGGDEDEIRCQKEFIRDHFVNNTTRSLIEDELGLGVDDPTEEQRQALELFQAMGSDLSIISYAFNFSTASGPNTDLEMMNQLNDAMFRKLSLQPNRDGEIPKVELFVTASAFDPAQHGQTLVDDFARRAGVEPIEGKPVSFLISTTQNPWLSNTSKKNVIIRELIKVLRRTAVECAEDLIKQYRLK